MKNLANPAMKIVTATLGTAWATNNFLKITQSIWVECKLIQKSYPYQQSINIEKRIKI